MNVQRGELIHPGGGIFEVVIIGVRWVQTGSSVQPSNTCTTPVTVRWNSSPFIKFPISRIYYHQKSL